MILFYLLYKVLRIILIVFHEKINLKYRIIIFHFRSFKIFQKFVLTMLFFFIKELNILKYILKIIAMKKKFIGIFN